MSPSSSWTERGDTGLKVSILSLNSSRPSRARGPLERSHSNHLTPLCGTTRERHGNGTRCGRNEAVVLAGSLRPVHSHSHLSPIPNVSLELGNSGQSRPPPDPRAQDHTCNFSITFFCSLFLSFFLRPVLVQVRREEPSAAADSAPRQCACECVCAFAAPPRTRAGFPRSAFNLFPSGWLFCGS